MISILTQFKQMFSRFCNGNAKRASYGVWSCGVGGYDKWFEIYYRNVPVCDCVAGDCEWYGNDMGLSERDVETIKEYITEQYEGVRFTGESD